MGQQAYAKSLKILHRPSAPDKFGVPVRCTARQAQPRSGSVSASIIDQMRSFGQPGVMWNKAQLALLREAGLAGNSMSAGLTALRKANYAHPGLYSHAFFSLSIGIERTLKLLYIMDRLVEHGTYPSNQELRALGHDIEALFNVAMAIKERRNLSTGDSAVSSSSIELDIVRFISRFSKITRYYNLDFLADNKKVEKYVDPIQDWFEGIGQRILQMHFTDKREARVRKNATAIQKAIGEFMIVNHTAEDGTPLMDAFSASYQTGKTEVIRKYGTFYSARLCRVFFYLLWGMRHKCHDERISIPYLDELYFPFMNDDAYLLSRKTFPPRGQEV